MTIDVAMTRDTGAATVALLGAGAMGTRVGARLLAAGHALAVHNRTPGRTAPLVALGARDATSPADAARGARFVISMVRDVEASRAVWLAPGSGAAYGLEPGAIAVESSTLTPRWVRELQQRLGPRGGVLLDAPVVGSRPQAEAGALVYLAGGDPAAVAAAQELLGAAGRVERVGDVGDGTTLKLAVNGLYAMQLAGLAELHGLLARSGIDVGRAVEAMRTLPVMGPALAAAAGAMASGDFAPAFPVELVSKDLGYLLELGAALGSRLPSTAAAAAAYDRALAAGDGDRNAPVVARVFGRPPDGSEREDPPGPG